MGASGFRACRVSGLGLGGCRVLARFLRVSRLLGGSWDLVSKVISALIGVNVVISMVTLTISRVTKTHDPLSTLGGFGGFRT